MSIARAELLISFDVIFFSFFSFFKKNSFQKLTVLKLALTKKNYSINYRLHWNLIITKYA